MKRIHVLAAAGLATAGGFKGEIVVGTDLASVLLSAE